MHAEYNKQQNAQRMIKNVDTLVYTTYVYIKNMLRRYVELKYTHNTAHTEVRSVAQAAWQAAWQAACATERTSGSPHAVKG